MTANALMERAGALAPLDVVAARWPRPSPLASGQLDALEAIESLGAGVLVVGGDLRACLVNAEFERLTGRRRETVLNTTAWMQSFVVDEGDWDVLKCQAGDEGPRRIKALLVDRRGTVREVALKIGVVPETNQRVIAIFDAAFCSRGVNQSAQGADNSSLGDHGLNTLPKDGRQRFGSIIGESHAMQRVYAMIADAAATDANVILYGESGTGKELAAHAIHLLSGRKAGAFVPVNCGAIPETLMESEFFGHRKGAFTGAVIDKHGFLDLADGGTLFLDELGEIGCSMQVKLLRAIDGGGFIPIGDSKLKTPDLRIIAATNRDLAEQVHRGAIREDFFYRIHVIPIHLPPLRERKEDIPLLVAHFCEKFAGAHPVPLITPRMMAELEEHDWPGNVRELQNTVHRFLTLKKIDIAGAPHRSPRRVPGGEPPEPEVGQGGLESMMEDYERRVILHMLERCRWQREATAEKLGIHRKTLFTKMKKHGLI
ncbi:MAG TPA: sigma-54 dependent transcriptional regulator [Desulfosarcina sp.]|nr:sigma-54 dependent transcriptional regulator [Desulfosarcina sp.]